MKQLTVPDYTDFGEEKTVSDRPFWCLDTNGKMTTKPHFCCLIWLHKIRPPLPLGEICPPLLLGKIFVLGPFFSSLREKNRPPFFEKIRPRPRRKFLSLLFFFSRHRSPRNSVRFASQISPPEMTSMTWRKWGQFDERHNGLSGTAIWCKF